MPGRMRRSLPGAAAPLFLPLEPLQVAGERPLPGTAGEARVNRGPA